jgi:DNA-binding transcriptional ArsR family regulator
MPVLEKPPKHSALDARQMRESAHYAKDLLKSLAHEGRLAILCRLTEGPATVGELEEFLGVRQAAVSQQLARLRIEGLVEAERDGRTVRYSIADAKARRLVRVLYDIYCR